MAQITLSPCVPRSPAEEAEGLVDRGGGVGRPERGASSRLNATGSMAKIRSAPARRAPWTALAPIPPIPITATFSPGRTSAA